MRTSELHELRPPERTRTPTPRPKQRAAKKSWVIDGIVAGLIGAAVIALFFLCIDISRGRPFWTPGTLGSSLFLGKTLPPMATPQPAVVIGYTLLHSWVFTIAGLIASFALMGNRKRLGPVAGLVLAGALFVGLEIVFEIFSQVAPTLDSSFDVARVALANLLAAVSMAIVLLRPPRRRMRGR
jgi:hypothetical protein